MGFVDLDKLAKKYTDGQMKENVDDLIEFDPYHCLLSGNIISSSKVQKLLGTLPDQFVQWLNICDGGMLFCTVMLSSKGYDSELDLEFETYEEANSQEAKDYFGLPKGFAVFAIKNYGDPLCFNVKENDGKVYHWNVDEKDFDEIWDSFEDWMTEEIVDALDLIAEDVLDPLGIKIDGNYNE